MPPISLIESHLFATALTSQTPTKNDSGLENVFELLTDYTLRTVVLGTAGIGAVSGAMGCFAYLRRQSLIGDVVSHSSLLGIIGFFMLSYYVTGEGSKSLVVLIPGAICAGFAALLLSLIFLQPL